MAIEDDTMCMHYTLERLSGRTTKDKYIRRALDKSKNVSSASKLLGLKNYQTLQNWMKELGIEDDRR
jgi:transposase-like protein